MIKLGIAIQKTFGGVQTPRFFNEGEWLRSVGDVRTILELVPHMQTLTFVRTIKDGILCCYVRRSVGRGGDNLALFLYIPAGARIEPGHAAAVFRRFVEIGSGERLDDDELQKLADLSFYERTSMEYTPNDSMSKKMAVRVAGDDNALGKYLTLAGYQTFNSDYMAVCIADSPNPEINAEDVSACELAEPITVIPPKAEEIIKKWGREPVELWVKGVRLTDDPLMVLKGCTLKVEARRTGRNPVIFTSTPKYDGQRLSLDNASAFTIPVSAKNFTVVDDENGKPVPSPCIRFNNMQIGEKSVNVKESEKGNLCITADGYEVYNDNNYDPGRTKTIRLKKQVYSFSGRIELRGGSQAEISLKGSDLSIKPELHGYTLRGNRYIPEEDATASKTGGTSRSYIIMAVMLVIGFVAGIGLTLMCQKLFSSGSAVASSSGSDNTALNYLNDNNLFDRDEMKRIPELQGLYDAMIDFDSARICTPEFRALAEGSARLQWIIDAISSNPYPKNTGASAIRYMQDGKINVNEYKEFLNDPHNRGEAPAPVEEVVVPDPEPVNTTPVEEQHPATTSQPPAHNGSEGSETTQQITRDRQQQYLNTQTTWTASEMSSLGMLSKLYITLNRGNINEFLGNLNRFVPENERSERLKGLVRSLEQHKNKNYYHDRGQEYSTSGSFNPYSDEYIQWLNGLAPTTGGGAFGDVF